MSRSGYSYDLEDWQLALWRGQVASAVRGKRGQRFLRDLLAALDAMPEKRLIAHELRDGAGDVCAIGAVGVARGVDMGEIDAEDPESVAAALDIAHQLAQEIAFENDEAVYREAPEDRYRRMRRWAQGQILRAEGDGAGE